MAAKKSTRTGGKRPPAGGQRRAAGAAKQTKSGAERAAEERLAASKQVGAIILFAVSIFLICLAFIPGASVWEAVRSFYFGLFGFCAYIWPFVLAYVAVMTSLDRPTDRLTTKVIEAAVFIVLLSSVIHVFTVDASGGYFRDVGNAYLDGIDHGNGGFFGAMIGGGLYYLFGKAASAATLFILMFVDLMFMTGFTLIRLFRTLWRPVQKIEQYSEERIQSREQSRSDATPLPRRRLFNVDVDLGPSAPAKDVLADEDTAPLPDIRDIEPGEENAASVPAENSFINDDKQVELKEIIRRTAEPAPKGTPVPAVSVPSEPHRQEVASGTEGYSLPPVDPTGGDAQELWRGDQNRRYCARALRHPV